MIKKNTLLSSQDDDDNTQRLVACVRYEAS
jgi:hypothetical protein